MLVIDCQKDHFYECLRLKGSEANSSNGLIALILCEERLVFAIEEQFGDVFPGHFGQLPADDALEVDEFAEGSASVIVGDEGKGDWYGVDAAVLLGDWGCLALLLGDELLYVECRRVTALLHKV